MKALPDTGPEILRYDSPEYELHKPEIQDVQSRMKMYRILLGRSPDDIVNSEGIVCTRTEGDDKMSAAALYSKRAIDILRRKRSTDETTAKEEKLEPKWRVVLDALAVHLSVMHSRLQEHTKRGEIEADAYRKAVRELDAHCEKSEIPSIVPSLFLPSSFMRQLCKEPAYKKNSPEMVEMYGRLGALFTWHEQHFKALLTSMSQNGRQSEGAWVLERIAKKREIYPSELCAQYPSLIDTYGKALYEDKRYVGVMNLCDALRLNYREHVSLAEYLLRSLLVYREFDELLSIFKGRIAEFPMSVPTFEIAAQEVAIEMGWQLYSAQRYDDAVEMIETAFKSQLDCPGNEALQTLYTSLLHEMGEDKKLDKYRERMGLNND